MNWILFSAALFSAAVVLFFLSRKRRSVDDGIRLTRVGNVDAPRKFHGTTFVPHTTEVENFRRVHMFAFIRQVEADHFRTNADSGSVPQAMMIWNCVRRHAGLKELRIEDLPAWNGSAYVANPDSPLVDSDYDLPDVVRVHCARVRNNYRRLKEAQQPGVLCGLEGPALRELERLGLAKHNGIFHEAI